MSKYDFCLGCMNKLGGEKECPKCGYPTRPDFVMCPKCHRQLRNVCTRCGRTLEPEWDACPYCATPVGQ